jgi:hypothetical protein
METSPAIVEGGCTSPGDLGAYLRHSGRFLRLRLEAVERALGSPAKIERYKLADGEILEFRFYQDSRAQKARTPSLWRRIRPVRKATPQTGQPRLWLLAVRKGSVLGVAGGPALYKRVITTPGVILVSSVLGNSAKKP